MFSGTPTYFNIKRDRSGHLFQGRYKSILVEADEYAKELSRYIHLNPVRANWVESPEEYAWSSYRYYIGIAKPPEWLNLSFILGYFGSKVSTAQKNYQHFVSLIKKGEYESPLKEVISSTLLGTTDFINFVKTTYLSDKDADKDIPALKELKNEIAISDIIAEVEKDFKNDGILERDIKIYLCRKYTTSKLRDIGIPFGIGESGVSQVCRRFSKRTQADTSLKRRLKKIEQRLSKMKT